MPRDASVDADDDARATRIRERETCASLVRFVRFVALERGRLRERAYHDATRESASADDASREDGGLVHRNEGSVQRARLLKLRARVARVRMQPRRARRPRVNLVAVATRNAARGDRGATPDDARERGAEDGYASDRSRASSGFSEGETSDRVGELLALLAHAPYAHESLEDGAGRSRGWTGSGSTMSRTGVIRVGVDHQASVEVGVDATFERGRLSEREARFLGALVWPTRGGRGARASKSPARKSPGKSRGEGARAREDARVAATVEDGENRAAVKIEEGGASDDDARGEDDEEEVSNRREPAFTDEEIAASRAALEDDLRRGGADEESLLGLRTIGAAHAREGWDDEEVAVFAEHATRYCDDLFRLRAKLPKKSMRDVVSYYYNVWQIGYMNYGRVDVEGAEEPAPRERARRGPAPKYTAEQVQREKDEKSLRGFVDWIRGVAINTKRAMLNVHRAPTTARVKGHMMTRWRTVPRSEDADEGVAREAYLKDLKRRMTAARFTKEEQEAAARMKANAKSSKGSHAKATKTTTTAEGDGGKKTASAPADAAAPTPKKRKRRIDDGTPKICRNCQAMETKQWRLPVEGAGVLCNACGLRDRKQAKKNAAGAAGETERTPKEKKTPEGKDNLKKKRSPKPTPDRSFQL